jgi:putative transposase
MRKLYPLSIACEVLEVSASGYFGWVRQRTAKRTTPLGRYSDEALLAYMRAIHAEVKQEYGWPRMHKELVARGIRVGKERVRRLMKQHGIRARTKREFVVTTDSKHSLPVAQDLVQRNSIPRHPISFGVVTSPILPPMRAGCTWLPSLTCSVGKWWVGV